MTVLFFVPMPSILTYYSVLEQQVSADDKTSVWSIALTQYVFLTGSMSVINARDGTCASYYS